MRTRTNLIAVTAVFLAAIPACSAGANQPTLSPTVTTEKGVVVVAVGDIAQPTGHQAETAALTKSLKPNLVLIAGDLAYYDGSKKQFQTLFLPPWGALGSKTWAVPGNHEYRTENANGYRGVAKSFNWPMQTTGELWWDKNIPNSNWAVIGLDSEKVSGDAGAQQVAFLKAALSRHQGQPTIVFWHRPRFSLGKYGDAKDVDKLWQPLAADKDIRIVIWGHEHNYQFQSFRYSNADGTKRFIDTFIAGVGGAELRTCTVPSNPPHLICGDNNYGVLHLTLKSKSYQWKFIHTDNKTLDSGGRVFTLN